MAVVDSLKIKVNEVEKKIAQVDSSKYMLITELLDKNLEFIDRHYKDTMYIETAQFLSDYAAVSQSLKQYSQQKTAMLNALNLSRSQLNALKHDLEKNTLHADSVGSYLNAEKKAVELLNESVGNGSQFVLNNFEKFDSLNPKVMEIVKRIEN